MSLELKLTGCRAVVTGASAGIGAAIARRLAAEGVHLHLAARSKGPLEALAAELQRAHAIEVTPLALDLSRSDAQLELASASAGVDILVNNAGSIPRGTLEEIDDTCASAAAA
jgi:short-subunit dehydrogenase